MPDNFGDRVVDTHNPYKRYTIEHLLSFLGSYEVDRKVGIAFNYSNLGFGLLGYVLSVVSEQDYETYLKTRILSNLRMTHTTISLPDHKDAVATGYDLGGNPVLSWEFTEAFVGAGAIRSNISDMMTYLSVLLGEQQHIKERAYFKDLFDTATTPLRNADNGEVGYAWRISPLGKSHSQRVIWHTGTTAGFSCFIGFVKQEKVGVVVLSNSQAEVKTLGLLLIKKLLSSTTNKLAHP